MSGEGGYNAFGTSLSLLREGRKVEKMGGGSWAWRSIDWDKATCLFPLRLSEGGVKALQHHKTENFSSLTRLQQQQRHITDVEPDL